MTKTRFSAVDYPKSDRLLDAFVLVDDNGNNRFPAIASELEDGLTQAEVVASLRHTLAIANKARAQIRRPVGSAMRATAAIVDARTRDGPVFGIDTALQKARTATFFSHTHAAVDLISAPDTQYLNSNATNSAVINIGDTYVGSVASGKGVRGFLGYNGDGHFGRLNITTALYYAFGEESSGGFVDRPSRIKAFFAAAESSIDFDWIRQTVPLVGGGGTQLSGRNGILNALRSSKEEGQSNFTNPGILLFGIGADFDITPKLRISTNINKLYFNHTETLEVLCQ